jgi:hypothetical protein
MVTSSGGAGGEEAQQAAGLDPGLTLRRPSTMPRAQRARWRARWTSVARTTVIAPANSRTYGSESQMETRASRRRAAGRPTNLRVTET